MKTQFWQLFLMLGAGTWLLCAPFWMPRYAQAGSAAVWHSWAAGASILLLAAIKVYRPNRWLDWLGLAIGTWLIVAPFVLGFANIRGVATSNHMISGLALLVTLGLGALNERRAIGKSRRSSNHRRANVYRRCPR